MISDLTFVPICIVIMSKLGSMAAIQFRRPPLINFWTVWVSLASPLVEIDNTAIIELEESLSGSASSDDDSEESDAINNLVNKTNRLAKRAPSPEYSPNKLPITPLTWFHSPPSTQLGLYRSVLPLPSEGTHYLDELRNMQIQVPEGRTWAVFMVAGGHFAGAIVRVSRAEDDTENNAKPKHKKPKPDIEVLLHKTFHRYTSKCATPSFFLI